MITIKNNRNREKDTFKDFDEFKMWVANGYAAVAMEEDDLQIWEVFNELVYASDVSEINEIIQGIEDFSDMYTEMYV